MSTAKYATVLSHPAEEEDEPPDGDGSVSLQLHLREVGDRARALVPADATTSEGDDLADVVELLGRLHDFGKLTTFFQAHVRDESPDGPTHHARLGAFITHYALAECGYSKQTRIASTVAVWKHHGSLPNVASGLQDSLGDDAETGPYRDVCQQIEDIQEHQADLAEHLLEDATDGVASWSEFTTHIDDVQQAIAEAPTLANSWGATGNVVTEDTYTDLLQLSSALVLADKTCAAGIGEDHLNPTRPSLDTLYDHLDSLGGDEDTEDEVELNRLRDTAQAEVAANVESFLDSEKKVATITLPTGYGKTLVGLRAALELQTERDTDGRIIYALPFTSIIDQTASTLQTVFDADPTGRKLTIHHHLAETVTVGDSKPEDGDHQMIVTANEPTDQYAQDEYLVGESWRSGMTLTTFVQAFESLAGPHNTQSMKLPALYGSVVIIDEPQALPLRWWPLVERLIEVLTDVYDARVILMTATQPELVDDVFDLIREKDQYFDGPGPDRVEYVFDSTVTAREEEATLDYYEAATRLVETTTVNTDAALAVCNTIDSASGLSQAVVEQVGEDSVTDIADLYADALGNSFGGLSMVEEPDGEARPTQARARLVRHVEQACDGLALIHLTTRLRPCDRRALLRVAADLTALDIPLVVVSTQLIEAGVDISFDRVYRDFAPLDSIVQAAGRCNRSFERDRGTVTVWQLAAPEGCETVPSKAVYARVEKPGEKNLFRHTYAALDATIEAFRDDVAVSEATVADEAVEVYHQNVGKEVTPDGIDMVEDFEQARAKALRRESLIEQHLSFELYICRTESESKHIEALREARDNWNFEKVERLRKDLAELRVSVPVYRADSDAARDLKRTDALWNRKGDTNWDDETERVLDSVTSPSRFKQYFDVRDGVHLPESGVEARFL